MTDRKWRIVRSHDYNKLYKKIEKRELEGYDVKSDSFGFHPSEGWFILMLNRAFTK
jgi:hypothetical protein